MCPAVCYVGAADAWLPGSFCGAGNPSQLIPVVEDLPQETKGAEWQWRA